MSGLASLAGYGSDSDDDDVPSVSPVVASSRSTTGSTPPTAAANQPSSSKLGSLLPPPKSGLASKLPPPSSFSSSLKPSGSGLSLPPPSSSSAKRKVIKVDSLPSFKDSEDGQQSDEEVRPAPAIKKPKTSAPATKHSLFGMLPAPKRKNDEVLAERKKEAEARKAARAQEESETPVLAEAPLRINEDAAWSPSPEDSDSIRMDGQTQTEATGSKPKGKTNDAFRAMLGLKPAAKKTPTPATATTSTSSSTFQAPSPKPVQRTAPSDKDTSSSTNVPDKAESAAVDFFSLGPARPSNGTASSSHSSSLPISAAPVIDHPEVQSDSHSSEPTDDASEYPGWQLDPDGSWVPVTPEAHAQLLAYQESLSAAAPASSSAPSRGAANLDGTRDLLAAGLTPDDIQAFDASTAAQQAYLQGNGDKDDSDKYAAAAEFAAGNREVQQRKPGMLKGLRKGQLSSLVSLANENRSKLEERWQRGRDAQARRSSRYGW